VGVGTGGFVIWPNVHTGFIAAQPISVEGVTFRR